MLNIRLIRFLPEALGFVRKNIFFQWLSLLAGTGITLILCHLCACLVLSTPCSIWLEGALLLGLVMLRAFFQKQSGKAAFESSVCVKKKMRLILFEKLAVLSGEQKKNLKSAELSQLASEGTEQLESYFSLYVPQFFYALLAPLTLFVILCFFSWKAALVFLICVPLIPASIIAVQKFAKKLLAQYWGQYTGLSDSFLENLQGLTTLKIYDADQAKHEEMNEEAESFRKMTMRVLIMQLNSISVMDLVAYGGAALGIAIGLSGYAAGHLSLMGMMAVILLSAEFFLPMRALGSYFHLSMNGSAAADQMFDVLDLPEPTASGALGAEEVESLQADHLCYTYPNGKEALKDVSFQIKEPGFYGIAGESGSGKSTLAALLAGELQDASGAITANSKSISSLALPEWQKDMAVLSFDSALFAGSVRSNLQMANPQADDAAMIQALEQAGIADELKDKGLLEAQVKEGGTNFSGGQKQRIAFARLLLKDAGLIILDEACSSIDQKSESLIMEQAEKLGKDKIVLCISHRLSSLEPAKEIFALRNGQLVQKGSFENIAKEGEFGRLYASQQELERYVRKEEE